MRAANTFIPLALCLGTIAAPTTSVTARTEADQWAFGDGFYTGPPSSGAYITKASWSLVPPPVPTGVKVSNANDEVWVSVWIGVSASAGSDSYDLYQPLLNWSPDQESQYDKLLVECRFYRDPKLIMGNRGCPATAEEWCVAASTYTPDGQVGQAYVTVPSDTTVDFEINVENNAVVQTVSMDGKVVSTESDVLDSKLQYLYSADECYTGSGNCGVLGSYSWTNITIHLNEADKNYGQTLSLYSGSASSGFTTSDGGLTWHADSVVISKDSFANAQ